MDKIYSIGFNLDGISFKEVLIYNPESDYYCIPGYCYTEIIDSCLFKRESRFMKSNKSIENYFLLHFENMRFISMNSQKNINWSLWLNEKNCIRRDGHIFKILDKDYEPKYEVVLYQNPREVAQAKKFEKIEKFIISLKKKYSDYFSQINNKELFEELLFDDIFDLFRSFGYKKESQVFNLDSEEYKDKFLNFIQSENDIPNLKQIITPVFITTQYPELLEMGIDESTIQERINDYLFNEDYEPITPIVDNLRDLIAEEIYHQLETQQSHKAEQPTTSFQLFFDEDRNKKDEEEKAKKRAIINEFGLEELPEHSLVIDLNLQTINDFETNPETYQNDNRYKVYNHLWPIYQTLLYTKKGKLRPVMQNRHSMVEYYKNVLQTLCSLNILQKKDNGYQFKSFHHIKQFIDFLKEER